MTKAVRHAARVLHTLRHLRARQLFYQARARLPRRLRLESQRHVAIDRSLVLQRFVARPESYLGGGRFRFVNCAADLGQQIDWSANDLPVLWQYNLHYFDYLQQQSLDAQIGRGLIEQWIDANPPRPTSVAWQPYPTSLRIVNWIKLLSRTGEAPAAVVQSLAVQTENLARQLEYHLLGNHLFANAKALWFAGVFLQQSDWVSLGARIILEQLREQFLPDGGHFELSPMYHAIAVEDLLDLINLAHACGNDDARTALCGVAANALDWLQGIVRSEGALPLLNDSANGIAPHCSQVVEYAQRLNITPRQVPATREFGHGWSGRNHSGYWVLTNGELRLLFDTALLGPDYLPGHAHCDMLSVLVEFRGQPVFTDTGVFEYAESERRIYSRSTAAHNTVQLDGFEQGEIWKSFRMGRRGHPVGLRVTESEISCEHTGFAIWRRGLAHRRTIRLRANGFEIVDNLAGPEEHQFASRFHFAPGTALSLAADNTLRVGSNLRLSLSGGAAAVTETEYYPEFGIIEKRPCVVIAGRFRRDHELRLTCTFSF